MLGALRPVVSLLCGVALVLLGSGLLNTLIPLRGHVLGFSDGLLGMLTSAYFGGFLLGTFLAPWMIRRVGHIRAFALCASVCACIALLHALSDNAWLWMLLRVCIGIALVGLYTVIESWLNAQSAPAQRGRIFAVYMIVNLSALTLAQQLLRFSAEQAFVLFVLVALLICASTLPVLWTRQSQPQVQTTPRLQLRRLFALAPSAGVGALLSGLAMGAFWGLLPIYAAHRGLGRDQIAGFMSVAIAGGAALQWPLGRLSDRHDRRVALMVVGALACVIALLMLLPSGRVQWPGYVAIFLYGGAVFSVYPIVVAHLLDCLAAQDVLGASSSVLLINGFGSALGPLIAGFAMGAFGASSLFAWFALTEGLIAVYAGYRYRIFRRIQVEGANFAPMLRTTPAALEMHAPASGDGIADNRQV